VLTGDVLAEENTPSLRGEKKLTAKKIGAESRGCSLVLNAASASAQLIRETRRLREIRRTIEIKPHRKRKENNYRDSLSAIIVKRTEPWFEQDTRYKTPEQKKG